MELHRRGRHGHADRGCVAVVELTWLACAATTGEVIAELPGLTVSGALQQVVNAYSTASAVLPIVDGAPPEWLAATEPNAAYLVLLADGEPVDGYLVTKRDSSEDDVVTLGLASVTAYFDRRFVGDETFTGAEPTQIVADLVETYVADSLPIIVEAAASDYSLNRTYRDADDKSVLSVVNEISALRHGPEWAVQWRQSTLGDRVTYVPVLIVADRLGVEPLDGLSPAVTFDLPGAVAAIQYAEDYASGQGANVVRAVSTVQANQRPESPDQIDIPTGHLRVEARVQPATSMTSVSELTDHAESALERMREGAQEWVITLNAETAPRFGLDWWLGDVISVVVAPGSTARWPHGFTRLFRVAGCKWTIANTPTVEPIVIPL